MASFDQKLRTLYLMEIMLERTDDEHMLNASELCTILDQEYGISTDRRTIYTEMEILEKFGLDIQQKKGKCPGYYIGARDFELPELKLLVDAVPSSKFITEKKPFVLYKSAVSMDGKTACHTGKSQWISSEESREEVRTLRGLYAAVMAGAGTIAADDPLLTARTEGLEDPVRIIADGKLSVSMESRVFGGDSRVIVLTTSSVEPEKVKALQSKGIEVIFADSDTEGCVDLEAAMIGLAVKGIDSILLEGGAETAASAFEAGIVDKIRFYMAPILIGGKDAPGAIGGTGAALIPEAVQLENIRTERSGVDLVVEGYVKKRKKVPAERPLPEKFKADISGKKGSTAVENEIRDQEPEKMQEEIKEPAEMEKAAEKMAEEQEARLPEGQA